MFWKKIIFCFLFVSVELSNTYQAERNIYFEAYRANANFHGPKTVTYSGFTVNGVGGAMNIHTGIFTAPRRGVYQFYFQAMPVRDNSRHVFLFLHNHRVVSVIFCHIYRYLTCSGQIMLHLNAGDSVKVDLPVGEISDGSAVRHFGQYAHAKYTVFSGRLLRVD